MAFKNAQQARASVGLLNASGYAKSFTATLATETLDTTSLVDTSKQFIQGMTSGQLSIEMMLDTTAPANSQFDVIKTWKTTQPSPVDFAPEGYGTGNPVVMYNALQTQATTSAAVNGIAMANVTAIAADDAEAGVSVEDYTSITITGNGTARDSGIVGGTTNGGVAHLHVTSISNTSDTVTIEHSVDGATSWATLVTFTAATAATSQRVVVAAGTTVRRYLRVVDTVVGAGTTVRQVSFARR